MVSDEVAPAGHGDLSPYSHKTQACFNENGGGEVGRCNDGDGASEVGQDVKEDDARSGQSKHPASFDPFNVAQSDDLSADNARDFDPHGQSNGQKDLFKALAKSQCQGEYQEECGDAPNHLEQPTHDSIKPASQVARECAEGDANQQGEEHGDESDRHRKSRTGNDPREIVPAKAIGAQNEGLFCQVRLQ